MGNIIHSVWRGDAVVGYAVLQGASDMWYETVEPTIEGIVDSRLTRQCTNQPGDDKPPHRLQHVTLRRTGSLSQKTASDFFYKLLYCPTCRCLISPPCDGYDYGDYPASWLTLAEDADG